MPLPPARRIAFIATTDCVMAFGAPVRTRRRAHEPPELRSIAHADLPRAAARGRAADEVRGADDPRRAEGAGRRRDLRARVAHRLARRLPGAAPRSRSRRSARSSIRSPTSCSPRPRSSRSCRWVWRRRGWWRSSSAASSPSPALRNLAYSRGVAMPASPLGKIKMVGAGRGDPRADPRRRSLARLLRHRAGRRCGWWSLTALVSAVDYFRRFSRLLNPRVADIAVARERRSGRKAG